MPAPRHSQDESLNDPFDADMTSPHAETRGVDVTRHDASMASAPVDASLASSSPADSTASFPDSLANAPAADIEAKAKALLALPSTVTPSLPHPGFEWHELPRPVPTRPQEEEEMRRSAVNYITKMLEKADRDDWMYETPAVFGPPQPLHLREGGTSRSSGAAGEDAGIFASRARGATSAPWQDSAFNLESYHVDGIEDAWEGFDAAAYSDEPLSAEIAATSTLGDTLGYA
ncbi:hypothetical protein JCM10908_000377 [Rhodotorula pacifica]|uniref:uncharacterized protein n=1 Tax=Rhodotorula pacifica TaxID=1495444 RepID=UPI00316FFB00